MIDAFILELRDMADVLMGKEIEVMKRPGECNPFSMKRDDKILAKMVKEADAMYQWQLKLLK